jgi:CRISPR system Cascade subunit CasE
MQHEVFSVSPRWGDLYWTHTRVMQLFGDLGPEPRRAGGILYRVEPELGRVLVQSSTPPLLDDLRVTSLDPFLTSIRVGQRVGLHTKVNIVKTVNRFDTTPSRRTREALAPHEIAPWITQRLAGVLDCVEVTGVAVSVEKQRNVPVVAATIDLNARCASEDELAALVGSGLGKAKSFGCGMISLRLLRVVERVGAGDGPSI